MKRLAAITLWLVVGSSLADMVAYNGVVRIWAESDSSIALHFHDWRKDPHIDDPEKPDTPFSEANRSAYVEVWSKTTGKRLWRMPSPALSYLWVSPDGRYIVGMSDIQIHNPYQLVVFDETGTIRLREHVVQQKAAFTADELSAFWTKFPEAKRHLNSRVKTIGGKHYVDFLVMDMPRLLSKEAWDALFQKAAPNPEFPYVGEGVTNRVYWFSDNPNPRVHEADGKTYLTFDSTGLFGPSKRVKIQIPQGVGLTGDPLRGSPAAHP